MFRLAFFAEIVKSQSRGKSASAAFVLDRSNDEHDRGDNEGKRLIKLGGDIGQPTERAGEGHGQRRAGHTQGIEETEDE